MEQELFEGLHKNRRWALEAVCQENLCRSWYLSYQLAGDAAGAASLLLSAWREALAALKNAKEAPGEDFQGLLSQKLLAQYQQSVQPDTRFENLSPPKVGESYQYLVGEVKRLPAALYWLCAYGGLDASQLAAVTGEDSEALAQRLAQGEEQLAQRRASWTKPQRAAYVRLSTQFRDPGGYGFQEVQLPVSLLHVLWKELGLPAKSPRSGPKSPGPPSASRFWALPWEWPPWLWRLLCWRLSSCCKVPIPSFPYPGLPHARGGSFFAAAYTI